MNQKQRFATQTLVLTLIVNGVLLAVTYLLAGNAPAFFGVGLALTLGLWFALQQVARRLPAGAAPAPGVEAPAQPQSPSPASPASALQLLSILQRKGRLIDFLQEDLQDFSDAQIGATVRGVHEGCRQALAEHIALEPIIDEAEGSRVTVEKNFDAGAIRLTGSVLGEPPFAGALQHRGWRVKRVDLPVRVSGPETDLVIAPAEVEVP